MDDFQLGVSSDGRRVLEADLGDEGVEAWILRAREHAAELLWLHTDADLAPHGLEPFNGYVRMRAERPADASPLPHLAPAHYAMTLDGAYRGLWGHKLVAAHASPPPGAVVLGLYERNEPIGICRVFTADRLVDGPGVLAHRREPAAYARLRGARSGSDRPGVLGRRAGGDRRLRGAGVRRRRARTRLAASPRVAPPGHRGSTRAPDGGQPHPGNAG